MAVRGEICCNIKCPRFGVEHVVCSNVMWNVVQWWRDVEWCGVEWRNVKGGVT